SVKRSPSPAAIGAIIAVAALALWFAYTPAPQTARHFPSNATIQELAEPLLSRAGDVGMVVGLIERDAAQRVVPAGRASVDGNTLFEIASVTKVFTGVLLANMVERGEVRLDTPVADLLADSARIPRSDRKHITLVDLATHTSGLGRPTNHRPSNP